MTILEPQPKKHAVKPRPRKPFSRTSEREEDEETVVLEEPDMNPEEQKKLSSPRAWS